MDQRHGDGPAVTDDDATFDDWQTAPGRSTPPWPGWWRWPRPWGMTVFDVIDHSGGARQAGLELRHTKLVILGSAVAGTPVDGGCSAGGPRPAAEGARLAERPVDEGQLHGPRRPGRPAPPRPRPGRPPARTQALVEEAVAPHSTRHRRPLTRDWAPSGRRRYDLAVGCGGGAGGRRVGHGVVAGSTAPRPATAAAIRARRSSTTARGSRRRSSRRGLGLFSHQQTATGAGAGPPPTTPCRRGAAGVVTPRCRPPVRRPWPPGPGAGGSRRRSTRPCTGGPPRRLVPRPRPTRPAAPPGNGHHWAPSLCPAPPR